MLNIQHFVIAGIKKNHNIRRHLYKNENWIYEKEEKKRNRHDLIAVQYAICYDILLSHRIKFINLI